MTGEGISKQEVVCQYFISLSILSKYAIWFFLILGVMLYDTYLTVYFPAAYEGAISLVMLLQDYSLRLFYFYLFIHHLDLN
jgi:uncharacterized membrane protein